MTISTQQKNQIKELLLRKIREKLENYSPETQSMPFHFRLLGRDRLALYSFIHSVSTMLGTSIFEQIGSIILLPRCKTAIHQYKEFSGYISSEAERVISQILRELKEQNPPMDSNKQLETQRIITVAQNGKMGSLINKRIDLFAEFNDGTEYYFELKTAKPNMDAIEQAKRYLLQWVAMRASIQPNIHAKTILVIPYNPYEPEPYQRYTLKGLIDLNNELLVGKDFWDFIGGNGTYEDLLSVFEEAGAILRPEIDVKMDSFRGV